MGVYQSMLEYSSPGKLAPGSKNTIILTRLLLTAFEVGQPEVGYPDKDPEGIDTFKLVSKNPSALLKRAQNHEAGTACTTWAHPLLFTSAAVDPRTLMADNGFRSRHPELIIPCGLTFGEQTERWQI
jgi:hypothetical protein